MQIAKLPVSTDDIEIINMENIGEGIIRVELKIKGILFKRIHSKWDKHLTHVWQDVNQHFGSSLMITDDKEKDLDAIFKAYLLTNKIKELS